MQKGFTLLELMVTLVILGIAMATVSMALPNSEERQATKEEERLSWVISEAHLVAQRYRTGVVISLNANGNGYRVLNLPVISQKETWALPYECSCVFERIDTFDKRTPLVLSFDAVLPHFRWSIEVGDFKRIYQYPKNHA